MARGDVVERALLVTRIRTVKNTDITIPNSMILGNQIINYTSSARDRGLVLHTAVTIGYDAPWRTVHELLLAAARSTPNLMASPEPFVLQRSLDDFYVTYELNAITDRPEVMERTCSALHQNIQDRFNEAGIEIMSPHYSAFRDGGRSTIPGSVSLETMAGSGFSPPAVSGTSAGKTVFSRRKDRADASSDDSRRTPPPV